MPGIASAATSVVIGHIAAGTKTIRVGAGGIMLPNHAPYVIAEQFGTLARLFPGRIDLGLGRAPGTDQLTVRALRRTPEARRKLPAGRARAAGLPGAGRTRSAHPGRPGGRNGSAALDSGIEQFRRACSRPSSGLPYAFASHFAPELLMPALQIYRSRFKPSEQLERPYAMVGVNIIAAEQRCRGAPAGDDAADVIREHLPRRARPEPAADRRHRELLVACGKGAGDEHAGALHRRLTGYGSRGHRCARCGNQAPTSS